MCRRLSLDELQTNHAAVLAKTPRTNETSKTPSAATTKLPVRTMETLGRKERGWNRTDLVEMGKPNSCHQNQYQ